MVPALHGIYHLIASERRQGRRAREQRSRLHIVVTGESSMH
jgi:hypothetical protein